jgi:hypothetical protein
VEVGDRIYVLMGADMSCVLRKVDEGMYSFGGEAYVHGTMDGEVLTDAAKKKSAEKGDKFNQDWLASVGDLEQPE